MNRSYAPARTRRSVSFISVATELRTQLATFLVMDLKQGELYLGRTTDTDEPVIYEADNLTTHGVIVGMTGSGKTGLGIDLVEEALLNGISCLIIDPKGDMGNLALNFPEFTADAFEPWMDDGTAAKEGKTTQELAQATADMWKAGLDRHQIGPERMHRLKEAADITIYTPGSSAGVGLNVLGSMKAPTLDWDTNTEVIRDEIGSFVSSLLVLASIDSDPLSGQEHILLSTIVEHFWKEGRDLDLATLVGQVPNPPFRKMGVFDIDTFFPEKDRMDLALQLNGLLASPSFAAWLEGEPLDIEKMIGGDKTKAAVVYMSHLSDEERQFLVTLLLGKTVTWIRSQPGTSELRAMIYMDEVFGFVPPTRQPPSKTPILTILKQARAHGVGMVLSTQNPVDLDYKAMSNAGTWMVGRLQTDNDKRRILDGLADAAGDVDINAFDKQISNLEKRQFILHSTKLKSPVLFGTRWAMSYLAGPLTRSQVTKLTPADEPAPVQEPAAPEEPVVSEGLKMPAESTTTPPTVAQPPSDRADTVPVAPEVADGVTVAYLDPAAPWASKLKANPAGTVLAPAAAATVSLVYDDAPAKLTHREIYEAVIFPLGDRVDASDLIAVDHDVRDFGHTAPGGAEYELPSVKVENKTYWRTLEGSLRDTLVATRQIEIFKNTELSLYSRVGEERTAFELRCRETAEDRSDEEMAKLRDKYETRIDRVGDRLAAARTRVAEAEAVASARQQESFLGTAGDVLGALLGGRSRSNPIKQAATRHSASKRAKAKAAAEATKADAKEMELAELEDELAVEIEEIADKWEMAALQIESLEIPLEKRDTEVVEMKLVWVPV